MEAAGLLLSIVFHWGVTTAFKATAAPSCIRTNNSSIETNSSLIENFTTTIIPPEALSGVPANVVIDFSHGSLDLIVEVETRPLLT